MTIKLEEAAIEKDIQDFLLQSFQKYGFDFRDYAPASLKRTILRAVKRHSFINIPAMTEKVVEDKLLFANLLNDLTITVTEMFRDEVFYRYLFQHIIPRLASYPSIRIWHAGCSTGEEVYSLAILLHEANLLHKSTLYATDINPLALQKARAGVYPIASIRKSIENYHKIGTLGSFSDYFTSDQKAGVIEAFLKNPIVFAEHNLVTDDVFSEVQLILCRNVLIYFNKKLQNRALDIFYRSLCYKGYVCLGAKESIRFSNFSPLFELLDPEAMVYRK